MAQFAPHTPHPADIARHVAVFPAVKKRRKAMANIWFFDSPKNGKRHIVTGDLQFMSFVLLEGTLSCQRYDPQPQPVHAASHGIAADVTAGAYVYLADGSKEWWDFRQGWRLDSASKQDELARTAAEERGMRYVIKSPADIAGKAILFDNWLNLCAGINRCRSLLLHRELAQVVNSTRDGGKTTVGELLAAGADHASMFAAIALALHRGFVTTDLVRRLVGTDSVLHGSGK
jgi:hypothetical protein